MIKSYAAQEIVVRRAADFSIGAGAFGKDERAFLADQFEAALKDQLPGELKYSLVGEKPAKVTIELSEVNVATGAGRQLNGASSIVKSRIQITDLETGQLVASSFIGASDEGARNNSTIQGIPVGAIASFIENKNTATGSTRILKIRDAYLRQLRQWFSFS